MTLKDDDVRLLVREVVRRVLAEKSAAAASPAAAPPKMLAIGADHGGFAMKQDLAKYLSELGYTLNDCGAFTETQVQEITQAILEALTRYHRATLRHRGRDGLCGLPDLCIEMPGSRAAND